MNEKLEEKLIVEVKKNPSILKKITNQTEAICLAAVKRNGYALINVIHQNEAICLEAVKQYGIVLQHVEHQTEAICLEAVKEDVDALRYVKDQTEAICLKAVKENGYALKHVKSQTKKICLTAINQNLDSGRFIKFNFIKKNDALIILKAYLNYNRKDKDILTRIIKQFNDDKKFTDFYTKHNLWKYVDFDELNNLSIYSMVL